MTNPSITDPGVTRIANAGVTSAGVTSVGLTNVGVASTGHVILVALVALAGLVGCEREPLPPRGPDGRPIGEYVPPEPVQLTPPASVIRDVGEETIRFSVAAPIVEFPVQGNLFRPIRAVVDQATDGQRRLDVVVDNEGNAKTFAEEGWHLFPTGAAGVDGTIMLCWNTLTGEPSEYSPQAPDPARGMALHCRLVSPSGELGPLERIRSPTVGCWIRRVVALGDGRYRLLFKGDDGWFEAGDKPDHGVYESYYQDGRWTEPGLLIPVPSISDP